MTGATHRISLDLTRSLVADPRQGHNRWHPDLEPAVTVRPGDTVIVDTRDGTDGQITPDTSPADLARVDIGRIHPLTGPIYVDGAEPGDVLDVEILAIEPGDFGFTLFGPGSGILGDLFREMHVTKWRMSEGIARCSDVPGVAIPAAPFIGTIGTSPSRERMRRHAAREAALAGSGALVFPPDARGAVPAAEPIASEGLRTIPPRESGGNMDNKRLRAGCRISLPVDVPGALLSLGDVHFAQGDGEACGQGLEMRSRVRLRVHLRKAGDLQWKHRFPVIIAAPPAPRRAGDCLVTSGIPIDSDGNNHDLDLTLAARNALLDMLSYLTGVRGLTREQAYALTSVAVDLHIAQAVNHPNALVSAVLPLDIFEDES